MNDAGERRRSARLPGLLGDTVARDYAGKLRLFNLFAEPELRSAIDALGLKPGMHVLDAGSGSGVVLPWLWDAVAPGGTVIGVDLASAHIAAARGSTPAGIALVQADLRQPPFASRSFDLIWSVNTVNHLPEPLPALRALAQLLRPEGRIALGQSSLLPDMFFAWDARLERLTTEAVYRYYRDRYGLSERQIVDRRALVGLLRGAALRNVTSRTLVIERVSPLKPTDEAYLLEAIFRDTWGERLRPYLSAEDRDELTTLCDPHHAAFALRRPDFHFLQTFTLVVAEAAASVT
jgi:SAM-dependent methyltransferase